MRNRADSANREHFDFTDDDDDDRDRQLSHSDIQTDRSRHSLLAEVAQIQTFELVT